MLQTSPRSAQSLARRAFPIAVVAEFLSNPIFAQEKGEKQNTATDIERARKHIVDAPLLLFSSAASAAGALLVKTKDGKAAVKFAPTKIDLVTLSNDGTERRFKAIHTELDATTTGFKAMAWVEVDADDKPLVKDKKITLRLSFPGNTFTKGDVAALKAMQQGELNPQIELVEGFMEKALAAAAKLGEMEKVIVTAHSNGSGSAIEAGRILRAKKLSSDIVLIEPYAAQRMCELLAMRQAERDTGKQLKVEMWTAELRKKHSQALDKGAKSNFESMQSGIISVRADPETSAAKTKVVEKGDENNDANKPIGATVRVSLPEATGLQALQDINHRVHTIVNAVESGKAKLK